MIAEDLGSANGLFADRGSERRVRIELDPNQPIRIGHTLLRVRQADFAVAPERVVGARRNTWPIALALGVIILALEAASLWLVDVTEPKLSRYLLPLLYVTLIVFGWSAAWAVLSRIFTGHAQFERNLLIAVTGLLVYVVIDQIVDVATFAFSWRSLDIYQFVFSWTLLAAICFLHLNEIGPSRKRVKAALVGLLALIGIGTQSLAQFDRPATPNQQDFARQLLPPSLRLDILARFNRVPRRHRPPAPPARARPQGRTRRRSGRQLLRRRLGASSKAGMDVAANVRLTLTGSPRFYSITLSARARIDCAISEAKRPGGLKVDDQLEFDGLLDG